MKRPLLPLLVLPAALALGACTGVMVFDDPGPRADYFDGDFSFATHKGAIVTAIKGNPFDMPAAEFRRRVLALMQGQNQGPPADFVAAPGPRTLPPYKVVVAFDPPAGTSPDGLCAGAGAAVARPARGLDVMMAFCFGDMLKSAAGGRAYAVSGADDAAFRALVRGVTLALIPAQDNEEQGEARTN